MTFVAGFVIGFVSVIVTLFMISMIPTDGDE